MTAPPAPRCACGHHRRTHLYREGHCQGTRPLGDRCRCEAYAPAEEVVRS